MSRAAAFVVKGTPEERGKKEAYVNRRKAYTAKNCREDPTPLSYWFLVLREKCFGTRWLKWGELFL